MNSLSTTKVPLLKSRYEGKTIYANEILGRPFVLDHCEIAPSRHNPGKDMLVAQIIIDGHKRVLFTESYSLIATVQSARDSPPYATKIIRKSDNYLYFTKLNKAELKSLEL